MDSNSEYYRQNALQFFESTVGVDMTPLYETFLSKLPGKATILDAGCGSGRDAKAFHDRGHIVHAFDASAELADLASRHCGFAVATRTFSEVSDIEAYDGIWCCASLLHVPAPDMPMILGRLWRALRPGGCIYLSFKVGAGERLHGGRRFTDADDGILRGWLAAIPEVSGIETWLTADQRPDRADQWLNALVSRSTTGQRKLVTGGSDAFLPHLSRAMTRATDIDIAVAFVKTTGLRLLMPELEAALSPIDVAPDGPKRMRLLASDYLDVTDPEALRMLLLLGEQGADVRVFATRGSSFHLKAYLFARTEGGALIDGTAFVGSSNISRQALTDGLEWNYRVTYPGDPGFLEARLRFSELFADARAVPLTDAWIDDYERRRVPPPRAVEAGSQEQEPPPEPTLIQRDALEALARTRAEGFRRGLVVLATGLGKTWLAAFDASRMGARRVLFVAHREEILSQAAQTFLRIRPKSRVGRYQGGSHDAEVDVLCASVQTLSRAAHLERFSPQHFDYVVIDEFHHAHAPTYRKLLGHFAPAFLLGLTATPDRTDQSDILSLCDDNAVFTCNLFAGIEASLLAPFHYYGIDDVSVDYREIPWKNGKFNPEELSNKLATLARARHAIAEWRNRAQRRTLAFCVSVRHADFMAAQFQGAGIAAAAVYSESALGRTEALERLREGRLDVIFSVDLFNEGVDLPSIDTVMMLRPTESRIMFLQQLGRGLRRSDEKTHLVVLDFIGNHRSFLQKPQALFGIAATGRAMAEFGRQVEEGRLELPEGCYVNYDLKIIEFLKELDEGSTERDYEALYETFGRRPTLTEFHRAGASLSAMRSRFGSWFELVRAMGHLEVGEAAELSTHADLLRDVEVTAMTKSFKMVLLEALLEIDGLTTPPTLAHLALRSWEVLQRRHALLGDLPEDRESFQEGRSSKWAQYWIDNPINAWIGGNRAKSTASFFRTEGDRFLFNRALSETEAPALEGMLQEVVDYRLASYEVRRAANVIPFVPRKRDAVELPYFPNLKIACGHFRTARADAEEFRSLPFSYGQLDPSRHFIARATGDSMDGGKSPIRDGDYLLMELVSPSNAGAITGTVMAIERHDEAGDNQYLLRVVEKSADGRYILKAKNPAYEDLPATDDMVTRARLRAIIDPFDVIVGQAFLREDIPALFGETFNPGIWNVGHVVLNDKKIHVLLVTLSKQGKAEEHRYVDHWIDDHTFHWQSQNATSPGSKRGQEIIRHEALGIDIHLFVRDAKLQAGKGAPFVYQGRAKYLSRSGSEPMSVTLSV
jgi:superfamily II DNA or RNA helicase/SAM-dependent methyltransferase/SOS-response transcriptional repressor LexA